MRPPAASIRRCWRGARAPCASSRSATGSRSRCCAPTPRRRKRGEARPARRSPGCWRARRYPDRNHLKVDRDLKRMVSPVSDYAKNVLVEADWLQEHLNDEGIRIVEVDENPDLY